MAKFNNKYNIEYYSRKRAIKRNKFYSSRNIFYEHGLDTNKIFFDYILPLLRKNCAYEKTIVDLGTGAGYVPDILTKLSNIKFKIIGIDLSSNMLKLAQQKVADSRVRFLKCDNFHLPFPDESIDIVTNKLTTQFSAKEVFRVLKKNGVFVFKEYGKYKGFKEIFNLFRSRYKKIIKKPLDYIKELNKIGFRESILNYFLIERFYTIEEIKEIFEMANLIEKFSKKDLLLIKNKLANSTDRIKITTDPFVIYARK